MIDHNFNPDVYVDSVLFVKASGSIESEIVNDLLLDNGKSIVELLNDQEAKKSN